MPAPADPRRALPPRRVPDEPQVWRREYRDHLQRPLSGEVVLYPVVTARRLPPITAPIVDGVAEVTLEPGVYTVAERLVGHDGVEVPYRGSYTITVP